MFSLKRNKVAKVAAKSNQVLDVFNKTVTNLTLLNSKIDSHSEEKLAAKAKLDDELAQLASHKEKHLSVISKLNKIIE